MHQAALTTREDESALKRVLVAYDDFDLGTRLTRTLMNRLQTCAVHSAADLDDALSLTREVEPDAILLGARVLKVELVDLLRSLRAMRRGGRPVIAVVTPPNAFVVWDLLRAAGADLCYLSPLEPDVLVQNLVRMVSPSRWA